MSKSNPNHIAFFKAFFPQEDGYAEREVNGWWLIKHWDGNKNCWTIDVYSAESYRNYKRARDQFREQQQRLDFIKQL